MLTPEKSLYLLWDESHLWGLMLWRALEDLDIPFAVTSASQVREGLLRRSPPAGFLVPGGWARLKADTLGSSGLKSIREYISKGGRYLGICGGAGLGLSSGKASPCLDLCSWSRKPMDERLPNFSGHVRCLVRLPVWNQSRRDICLPVWWPSQFKSGDEARDEVSVLASYLEPADDFWTADLPYSDLGNPDVYRWEEIYGINLDPAMLAGEPCIIYGRLGRGEYVLSYSHLETPGSAQANQLLQELLWTWMNRDRSRDQQGQQVSTWDLRNLSQAWEDHVLVWTRQGLEEVIELGRSHFLFYWRTPWLLGWRRGVPGAAVNFLYAMVSQALHHEPAGRVLSFWEKNRHDFARNADMFLDRLRSYLIRERLALTLAQSSPESSSDMNLQEEKEKLFGNFPGYGGLYARLIRPLDRMLYLLAQHRYPC